MLDIQWNTGVLYTRQGQVIRAVQQKDGSILFVDLSRGISGRIEPPNETLSDVFSLRDYVMQSYQHNRYRGDAAAAQLGPKPSP